MSQRAEQLSRAAACLAMLVLLGLAAPTARAQDDDDESLGPTDAVEAYMRDRGLDDLLSVYLLDRLRDAPGSKRAELADRLGKHYARLLSAAGSSASRYTRRPSCSPRRQSRTSASGFRIPNS
mgnify:CR=1 FL=1